MTEIIWGTNELRVIVDDEVELKDAWTGNYITVPVDELIAFAKHWLVLRGYNVIKREPVLLLCPNPECKCRGAVYVDEEIDVEEKDHIFVLCDSCGYCGPEAETPEEAVRLHNLIAERATSEECEDK